MAKRKIKHQVSSRTGANQEARTDGNWWRPEGGRQSAQALWDTVTILNTSHGSRRALDSLYVGMYENEAPAWMGSMAPRTPNEAPQFDHRGRRVTLNVGKSVIDTITSMIAKNLAEVRVLTNGGTWREQRRAKDLTKYLSGVFRLAGYHQAQQRSFIDGCLTRARGLVEFWADKKAARVRCRRTHPRTILWNDLEGEEPQNLFQRLAVPRESLLVAYGAKHREAIENAPKAVTPVTSSNRRLIGLAQYADMVDVYKGWHLPPDPKTPGRYMLVINGGGRGDNQVALVDDPWKLDCFPFADFSWQDADEGWGGKPLMDTLAGYQKEVGQMLRTWRTALGRAAAMSGPWVEDGSETIMDELTDGGMWQPRKYRGTPPTFSAPPALGPDFFQGMNWLYDKAFAEAGISMLQAQGMKPGGLDSGEALIQYNDITATRQVIPGQRLERQSEKAAKISIALSRELYVDNKELQVLAPGTKFLQQIRWRDVDMDEDAYQLQASAVSALPQHAAGRIQALVNMIKGGLLPPEEIQGGLGLKLLNFPDLEKVVTMNTANHELATMQADSALYEGEYIGPEPFQDLGLLKSLATKQLLVAYQLKDVPAKNLRYLERLAVQADALQKRGMAPVPQAPAAALPAMPAGPPGLPAVAPAPGVAPLPMPAVPTTAPALPGAMPV